MPQSPNQPTASEAPSPIAAIASAGVRTTLSMPVLLVVEQLALIGL